MEWWSDNAVPDDDADDDDYDVLLKLSGPILVLSNVDGFYCCFIPLCSEDTVRTNKSTDQIQ